MKAKIIVKGYKLTCKIESSGLRSLYRAVHQTSGEEVFMQIFTLKLGKSLNLLMQRAKVSKQLHKIALIVAKDYGYISQSNHFYYTYPYEHYRLLSSVLSEHSGDIYFYTLAKHMLKVLKTVDYLHRAGTTHRHLTKNQLLVNKAGELKINGFINTRAKYEPKMRTNMIHMPYLAPELLMGTASVDRKTDIYSLGVIFYELLTGKLPFKSNHAKIQCLRDGIGSVIEDINHVPKSFKVMFSKALANRKERFTSVNKWMDALENYYNRRPFSLKIKDLSTDFIRLLKL